MPEKKEDDWRNSEDRLVRASVGTYRSLDKPAEWLRCEIFLFALYLSVSYVRPCPSVF